MKKQLLHIFSKKDIYLPVALLLILSIPFYIWDLDIAISSWFYDSFSEKHWILKNQCPWNIFYKFGTWPAIGISIVALFVFISCIFYQKFIKVRKKTLYIAAVMIIGPGIIINSIFKDNFGRPRPRNIEQFGGEQKYHQLLESDWGNKGRAFPCGHCSTAFYFFTFYFLFKKNKRKWLSYTGLSIGIGYGLLMGIARIGQGGHFASDVLWSAGFVYLTAGVLYYIMFEKEQQMPES